MFTGLTMEAEVSDNFYGYGSLKSLGVCFKCKFKFV